MGNSETVGQAVLAWVIFADIKGFTDLNDDQMRIYYRTVLPGLTSALKESLPVEQN